MKNWTTLAGAVAVMGSVLWAPASDAMQMDLTRSQLCALSDVVLVGDVTDLDTLWAATPNGGLERHAFVSVDKVLKGDRTTGAIVILPGGTMGDFNHWVEDVPNLESGTRYALFLGATKGGYEVLGGERGAVRIATERDWHGESVDGLVKSMEACNE